MSVALILFFFTSLNAGRPTTGEMRGFGLIPEDMDTIPWVHKVTEVPVKDGKPCADSVLYVDLSHEMPPVGNQRWQNCCTAWGFAYYHRTHVEFLDRGWDLTDGADWLSGGPGDTLYVACVDDTVDGRAGSVDLFEVEHLEWQTQGTSLDVPMMIPDYGDTAYALLHLPSTAVSESHAGRTGARRDTPAFVRGVLNLTGSAPAVLLDIAGRRVADLAPGRNDIGRLSPGVYFVARDGLLVGRAVFLR